MYFILDYLSFLRIKLKKNEQLIKVALYYTEFKDIEYENKGENMNKERRRHNYFKSWLGLMVIVLTIQTVSTAFAAFFSVDHTVPVQAAEIKKPTELSEIYPEVIEGSEQKKIENSNSRAREHIHTAQTDKFWFKFYSDKTAELYEPRADFSGVARIPNAVTYNNEAYAVIKIEDNAFTKENTSEANKRLTGIEFAQGSNLEVIGASAFKDRTSLTGTLDFSNCTKLRIIWDWAFQNTGITGLVFGENSTLNEICNSAFKSANGLGGKPVRLPDSLRILGKHAFLLDSNQQRFSELKHNPVLELTGDLPTLQSTIPELSEEAKDYESQVDSSNEEHVLHKAAKWLDEDRTTAEIRIDYGKKLNQKAKLDVVVVQDFSDSMQYWAEAVSAFNGEKYKFHRSLYLNDIINGAAKLLLETPQPGYDNRMSLVAFSYANQPIYKTDFTKDTKEIAQTLLTKPNMLGGATNYGGGLQGAIDIIKANQDPDRIPVVIFLSDGYPSENGEGIAQAKVLRDLGVRVYPIGIYVSKGGLGNSLKAISYDEQTEYLAEDSAAMAKIMEQVLDELVEPAPPLDLKIKDILSEEFEFTGNVEDIQASTDIDGKKTTTIDGKSITWDLTGCEAGIIHTLKIKVKLKAGTELSASGTLPTNLAMGAEDESITSSEQPELKRYLVHHIFENETDPKQVLPEEITQLKPGTMGGYADQHVFTADSTIPQFVDTKDGQRWEFTGWDKAQKTIEGEDVTFVGKWRYVGYNFRFVKQAKDGNGLQGAEFNLYAWVGEEKPAEQELVTDESEHWKHLGKQTSQAEGVVEFFVSAKEGMYFQLVETKAPNGYIKPSGQWRFTLQEGGVINQDSFIGIAGSDGKAPPQFTLLTEGKYAGIFRLLNEKYVAMLPQTGGKGKSVFAFSALLLSISGVVLSLFYVVPRIKKQS